MKPTLKEQITECRKLIADYEKTCKKVDAALQEKRRKLKNALAKANSAKETIALAEKYPENHYFARALSCGIQELKFTPYVCLGTSDVIPVKPNQKIEIWISGTAAETDL